MAKQSAGILLYRVKTTGLEVLLVHPGGPFWAKKDAGAWSIPKGEFQEGEDAIAAARREFAEETGLVAHGALIPLGHAKQPSGKTVYAWALEGDCDATSFSSNLFTMEWPPRSGQHAEFPEVDRAEWFSVAQAKEKLLKGQVVFLDRLSDQLHSA
jgi:predicted NUDIX family NTP pyrophosphohydrolase